MNCEEQSIAAAISNTNNLADSRFKASVHSDWFLPDRESVTTQRVGPYVFVGTHTTNPGGTVLLSPSKARHMALVLEHWASEIEAELKPSSPSRLGGGYPSLTDQSRLVLNHMRRAGSISAREAVNDHGITSATLARRICDIEEAGYGIHRERKVHPVTSKRYTRYSLTGGSA
jgi:DNA-binding MarR family transcriptional regulator